MNERTSQQSRHHDLASPDVPVKKKPLTREGFQVMHPEVGFARQPHCDDGESWIAYWLSAEDGKPRHITGATEGAVLDKLKPLFGDDGG